MNACCLSVGVCSVFNGVKIPKEFAFSGNCYLNSPSVPDFICPFNPRGVVLVWSLIVAILIACSQAQVANSVVSRIPIDVINFIWWPVAIGCKPDNRRPLGEPAINADSPIVSYKPSSYVTCKCPTFSIYLPYHLTRFRVAVK